MLASTSSTFSVAPVDGSQCTVKLPSVLLVGDTVTFCTIGGGGAWLTATVIVAFAPTL